jgi:hypothetical protein
MNQRSHFQEGDADGKGSEIRYRFRAEVRKQLSKGGNGEEARDVEVVPSFRRHGHTASGGEGGMPEMMLVHGHHIRLLSGP